MPADVTLAGSVSFWLRGDDEDWATSSESVNFPPFEDGPIQFTARKRPDRTLEITIDGPFGQSFAFKTKCPKPTKDGVHVLMSWAAQKVSLYVQGKFVKAAKARLH